MEYIKKRKWAFDSLKGISCIIIILFHCPIPGLLGEAIIYALRFPVPIFFMITGYFSYFKDEKWLKRKFISMFKIIIISEILYGFAQIVVNCTLKGETIKRYLSTVEGVQYPLRTIVTGTFFNGTLWYLYAAFWTYLILILISKINRDNKFNIFFITVLLLFQIAGRYYYQNHYDIDNNIFIFRNAITFGLPLTLIGRILAKHERVIKGHINTDKACLMILFGLGLIIVEYIFSHQYMDFHFSSAIISIGLFILAMVYTGKPNRILKGFSFVGKQLSTLIYLSHYMFILIINYLADKYHLGSSPICNWIKPICVCSLSCLTAYIYVLIKNKYRRV
ncbi:MAG: acyltransferase family protein [Velocimicrobium sp.]